MSVRDRRSAHERVREGKEGKEGREIGKAAASYLSELLHAKVKVLSVLGHLRVRVKKRLYVHLIVTRRRAWRRRIPGTGSMGPHSGG